MLQIFTSENIFTLEIFLTFLAATKQLCKPTFLSVCVCVRVCESVCESVCYAEMSQKNAF